MEDRDLDAGVATVIEMRPALLDVCPFTPHDTLSPKQAWVHTHNKDGVCRLEPRAFSSEPVLCSRVEDEIERRGLQGDYIAALWNVMGAERGSNFWTQSNIEAFWNCIRATPKQRCKAALVAFKGEEYHQSQIDAWLDDPLHGCRKC